MYFTGELGIDPAQMTRINPVKPTKAFARMLFHLIPPDRSFWFELLTDGSTLG